MRKDATDVGARLCAPTETDTSNLPELPRGWVWTNVQVLKGISGLIKDGDWILSEDLKTGKDVRLIQLGDIGSGYFLDKSSKFISSGRALELHCTFLRAGDVLVSRMADPIARACILPELPYNTITAVDVTILRPDVEFFSPRFICWLFNSEFIRKQAEQLSSGTTRKRVSRKNLEILSVPLPPLPEQQRIVVRMEELFTELDAGVEALQKVKAQLKRYRQAVLKHAFEGRLTEEWRQVHRGELEPASVLLERIRSERAKTANVGAHSRAPRARAPRPYTVDISSLPQLPEGWAWTTVGELFDVTSRYPRAEPVAL